MAMWDPLIAFFTVFLLGLFVSIFFVTIVATLAFFSKKKEYSQDFKPEISIIIPAYNAEKTIEKCLKLVIGNKYPKKEIIVVNDGSTDKTVQKLKKFKEVKVLTLPHRGKVNALNEGIKKAKNEIILTLDADTFVKEDSIAKTVEPFQDKKVGAVTVTVKTVKTNSIWNAFQELEYLYNNLIRESFYRVFGNAIWFFGAMVGFRKTTLKKIGYFKETSLAEDMFALVEIKRNGFQVVSVADAEVTTIAPDGLKDLFDQRTRWWAGGLQALNKNRGLLFSNPNPAIIFLFANQLWFSLYSLISIPMTIFFILYWYPFSQSIFEGASYLFRWFSIFGPLYVIYMIPQWGISPESIFGVVSGILMAFLLTISLPFFQETPSIRKILAIIFYFPYTIVINIIIVVSLLKFRRKSFFIR